MADAPRLEFAHFLAFDGIFTVQIFRKTEIFYFFPDFFDFSRPLLENLVPRGIEGSAKVGSVRPNGCWAGSRSPVRVLLMGFEFYPVVLTNRGHALRLRSVSQRRGVLALLCFLQRRRLL